MLTSLWLKGMKMDEVTVALRDRDGSFRDSSHLSYNMLQLYQLLQMFRSRKNHVFDFDIL